MKRNTRRFLNKDITFIVCVIFLIVMFFMVSGYSILKSNFNLTAVSKITDEEPWNPDVSFINTKTLENFFFYDIIIFNNSKFDYKDWQVKLYNADYILYTDMLER